MGLHERQKTKRRCKNKGGKHLEKKPTQQAKYDRVVNRSIKAMSIVMFVVISVSIMSIVISSFTSNTVYTDADESSSISSENIAEFISLSHEQTDRFVSVMMLNAPKEKSLDQEETIDPEKLIQLHKSFIARLKAENKQLMESYDALIAKINEFYSKGEEILSLYDSVKGAVVCSKANKFNNSLQETYAQLLLLNDSSKEPTVCLEADTFIVSLQDVPEEMEKRPPSIQDLYACYEESYAIFKQDMDKFSSGRYLKPLVEVSSPQDLYEVYMKYFFGTYGANATYSYTPTSVPIEELQHTFEEFLQYEEELSSIAIDSQKIADDFFDLVFYDATHIANAEAGSDWYPPEDIYYVLNVIENRVESPKFRQNTFHDVVFAPGQYSPTWTGSFYKEPTKQVIERVTTYLRGYVETGMPSNVVFQATFKQGDYVWKRTKSGDIFCGKYGA